MDINLDLVVIIVGILIFCWIFKKPLSAIIERITKVNVKRKNKDNELEVSINSENFPKEKCINEESAEKQEEKIIEKKSDDSIFEVYLLLKDHNFEDAERYFQEYMKTHTHKDEQINAERFYLHYSYFYNKDKSYDKLNRFLDRLEDDNETGKTIIVIGELLERDNRKVEACSAYKKGYELRLDEDILSDLYVAHSKAVSDSNEDKINFLYNKLIAVEKNNSKYKICMEVYKILSDEKNPSASYILEKAISYSPNDDESLFDIAYKHEDEAVQAFYYNKLLKVNPKHSAGLNNLGVCYESLKLPISSINSFKSALELGESLSAANMANRLIRSGFKEEAIEILNTEKSKESYHENIDHNLSRIHSNENEENDKKKELEKSLSVRAKYFSDYGEYVLLHAKFSDLENRIFVKDYKSIKFYEKDGKVILEFNNGYKSFIVKNFKIKRLFKVKFENSETIIATHKIDCWMAIQENALDVLMKSENGSYERNVFTLSSDI